MPVGEALESAHYPETFPARDAALRRLGFDELLALEIGMVVRERQRRVAVGEPVAVTPSRSNGESSAVEAALTEQLQARTGTDVAARLTDDQAAAVQAIAADLGRPQPMMRLLQGDVGSGKTAVAALGSGLRGGRGPPGSAARPDGSAGPPARRRAAAPARAARPLRHAAHRARCPRPRSGRRWSCSPPRARARA